MGRTRRLAWGACTGIFVVTVVGSATGGVAGGVGAHRGSSATQHADGATGAPARHELLTLSDMPTGWAESADRATNSHGPAWSAPLARCVGVPPAVADAQPTRITSPDFTSDDKTLAVEDSVSVYKTAAEARAQFSALDNKKMASCMNAVAAQALRATVQSEVGSNATVGTVSIAGLNTAQFPHDAGFSLAIPLVYGGRELTIRSTEVDFVTGRLNQQLTFNGNGAGFPCCWPCS